MKKSRQNLYKELEGILAEKAANVYIQDLANLVAVSDKYDGYDVLSVVCAGYVIQIYMVE